MNFFNLFKKKEKLVQPREIVVTKQIISKEKKEIFMKDCNKVTLKIQDQQLAAVHKAWNKYKEDKDLNSYISFWEMVWENGGLRFEGSKWHFELPDLYIRSKRYDDALAFLTKLKKDKPRYTPKSNIYITKIEVLKEKWKLKNNK